MGMDKIKDKFKDIENKLNKQIEFCIEGPENCICGSKITELEEWIQFKRDILREVFKLEESLLEWDEMF